MTLPPFSMREKATFSHERTVALESVVGKGDRIGCNGHVCGSYHSLPKASQKALRTEYKRRLFDMCYGRLNTSFHPGIRPGVGLAADCHVRSTDLDGWFTGTAGAVCVGAVCAGGVAGSAGFATRLGLPLMISSRTASRLVGSPSLSYSSFRSTNGAISSELRMPLSLATQLDLCHDKLLLLLLNPGFCVCMLLLDALDL
jgi:hypothetical protein